MKKRFLTTIAVAIFLAVVMLPGAGYAAVSTQGLAYMTWNSPAFEASVNWLDPTGADTRGSFSSAAVTLNGTYDPDGNDAIDGAPWDTTGFSITLADGTGSVNGSGYTTPSLGVQEAYSSIAISGDSNASVDIAQGVLRGQFTVAQDTPLDILADYLLQMSLFNTNTGENSYVDVSVGLTLSDFDLGTVYATDSRFFSLSLADAGSSSFFLNFQDPTYAPLQLTNYTLVQGITYDFEAQASTVAYATSVPEPMSLILLASGMAGLAIFRKRFA